MRGDQMRNSIINSIAILIISLSLLGITMCNAIMFYKIHHALSIMAVAQTTTEKLAINNKKLIESIKSNNRYYE
jgi:hypothetical protein